MGREKGRRVRSFFLRFFDKSAFEVGGRPLGGDAMIASPALLLQRTMLAGAGAGYPSTIGEYEMKFCRVAAILSASGLIAGVVQAGEFRVASGPATPYQYIVILDHDPGHDLKTLRPELSTALAARRVAVPVVWNSALNGFVMSGVGAKSAMAIAKMPGVVMVEPDYAVQASATQINAPIGLDSIDQRDVSPNGTYVYNYTAPTVHAYVIDSGIRTTHVEFGGRATADANFSSDSPTNEAYAHGTGVASIIGGSTFGVAKQVRLHSVRVLASNGYGTASQVISGLNWVSANGIHPGVINMSLQLPASTAVDAAVDGLIGSGFVVVVAAGNQDLGQAQPDQFADACVISPARVPAALTVASFAKYSYRGTCVDAFAPGNAIPVASSASDSLSSSGTGTSYSAPHVAGAVALILQQSPSYTPKQVSWELIARSTKNLLTESNNAPNDFHLYGAPNRWLYTLAIPAVPMPPADLEREACHPPTYRVNWLRGAVGSTNTPAYFELQVSPSTTFSTTTSAYFDANVSGGTTGFTWPTPQYVRIRECNSTGCSAFTPSHGTNCSVHQ